MRTLPGEDEATQIDMAELRLMNNIVFLKDMARLYIGKLSWEKILELDKKYHG